MKPAFVKRGRLEIIYEILSICQKPTKKTNILYKCNLSYAQLQKYLEYLSSHRLLGSFRGRREELYEITGKGKEFLEGYRYLAGFLQEKQDSPVVVRNGYRENTRRNHALG